MVSADVIANKLGGEAVDLGSKVGPGEIKFPPGESFAKRIASQATEWIAKVLHRKETPDESLTVRLPENHTEVQARGDLNNLVIQERLLYEQDFLRRHGTSMTAIPGVEPESKVLFTAHDVPDDEVAEAHAANSMFKRIAYLQSCVDWTGDEAAQVGWFMDRAAGQRRLEMQKLSMNTDQSSDVQEEMQRLSDEISGIEGLKQRLGIAPQEKSETALLERQIRAANSALRESQYAS